MMFAEASQLSRGAQRRPAAPHRQALRLPSSGWLAMVAALLLMTTVTTSRAQAQQEPSAAGRCGSEADELASCAAKFGNIDVGPCLSCVADALSAANGNAEAADTAATAAKCDAYNATFCGSILGGCQASCDDYRCGAEFTLYYLCEADWAYKNVTASAEQEEGLCDISCGGIGNSSSSDTSGSGSNGTATDGEDDGGGSGGEGAGSCGPSWDDLRTCLSDQGRDEQTVQECASCVQDAIPLETDGSSTTSLDCPALNEQYCNAVTSCESVCARAACADELDVHVRCAAEARAAEASASDSTCQVTACGADATSAAARDASILRRASATLAVLVAAAAAL